ncbi:MAG TPA: hypothetical protein VK484_00630 [Ferruginibacter sp.]|nr:hypothetical protein [Ferruginibacter sp.]
MNDSWFHVAAYCALAGLNKKSRWQHRASPDADIYRPFRAFIFLRKNFTESDANRYKEQGLMYETTGTAK